MVETWFLKSLDVIDQSIGDKNITRRVLENYLRNITSPT
jgi:hypothetical protein